MGFSWSSAIAQETLLTIADHGGLGSTRVLAEDAPLPNSLDIVFAAATDDIMVFSDQGPGSTREPVERLEASLRAHGALKNPAKDVDDSLQATCIGVNLVDGRFWKPPGVRLWGLIRALLHLSCRRVASPGSVAAYLGVAQWFDLLRRLRLSVFFDVYFFCAGAKATDWIPCSLPSTVMLELLVDATLGCFGCIDMRRPYLPLLGATDASTVFGHGAAVTPMTVDQLRTVSRLCCKAGDHVTLADGPLLPEPLSSRLGPRHVLNVPLGAFQVVISVRVESPQHINLEEANALLRYVRWILRSAGRFGRRIVVLLDSRVVIGAVAKGRSGSLPLNRLLRRLAALTFAGGLILHLVFIPTSHNPSDWPSRGGPKTWPTALRRHGVRSGRHGSAAPWRPLAERIAELARTTPEHPIFASLGRSRGGNSRGYESGDEDGLTSDSNVS